jgi:hypothetical protein
MIFDRIPDLGVYGFSMYGTCIEREFLAVELGWDYGDPFEPGFLKEAIDVMEKFLRKKRAKLHFHQVMNFDGGFFYVGRFLRDIGPEETGNAFMKATEKEVNRVFKGMGAPPCMLWEDNADVSLYFVEGLIDDCNEYKRKLKELEVKVEELKDAEELRKLFYTKRQR